MSVRDGLTRMTKVEVVVGGADVPAVRDLLQAAGASGFTSVTGVSGLGHSGYHQGRLLFNEHDTLELVICVLSDARAGAVLEGLRALLAEVSGVVFVSDTYVSRPEYFG